MSRLVLVSAFMDEQESERRRHQLVCNRECADVTTVIGLGRPADPVSTGCGRPGLGKDCDRDLALSMWSFTFEARMM